MAFSANQSKKNYECTITVYRSCVGLSTDEAEEKGLQRTINVDIQTESEFLRLCCTLIPFQYSRWNLDFREGVSRKSLAGVNELCLFSFRFRSLVPYKSKLIGF